MTEAKKSEGKTNETKQKTKEKTKQKTINTPCGSSSDYQCGISNTANRL